MTTTRLNPFLTRQAAAWFRLGKDTLQIEEIFRVSEAAVYNSLSYARERVREIAA